MTNTPSSSSGAITSFDMQLLIGQLVRAVNAYTPESIAAAAKAEQDQLVITGEMKTKYAAAQAVIAQAADMQTQLDAQSRNLASREMVVTQAEKDNASVMAALDARIKAFNAASAQLDEENKKLAETAAQVNMREAAVGQREQMVADREKAVALAEKAVEAKKTIMAQAAAQLSGSS